MSLKLILQQRSGFEADDEQDEGEEAGQVEQPQEEAGRQVDPRQELAELKKKKRTWKLAGELITMKMVHEKDLIMTIARSTWKESAERAKTVVSPQQVLQYNIVFCN